MEGVCGTHLPPTLGAFVIRDFASKYYIADVDSQTINAVADGGAAITVPKLHQDYKPSGTSMSSETRTELEKICAGA